MQIFKHDFHDFESNFVISSATEPVAISHTNSITGGDPCSQQQPPDGHASTWTEPTCELSQLGRTPHGSMADALFGLVLGRSAAHRGFE
jgi:hypothetical protein